MIRMNYLDFVAIQDNKTHRIIDVREQDEFNTVHVHGVELFPLSRVRQGEMPEEDDRQIVLICRSGARSAMAGQLFEAQGFRETINIENGTMGAIAAGEQYVTRPAHS